MTDSELADLKYLIQDAENLVKEANKKMAELQKDIPLICPEAPKGFRHIDGGTWRVAQRDEYAWEPTAADPYFRTPQRVLLKNLSKPRWILEKIDEFEEIYDVPFDEVEFPLWFYGIPYVPLYENGEPAIRIPGPGDFSLDLDMNAISYWEHGSTMAKNQRLILRKKPQRRFIYTEDPSGDYAVEENGFVTYYPSILSGVRCRLSVKEE